MFKKDSMVLGVLYGLLLPLIAYGSSQFIEKFADRMVSDGFLYIICIGINVIIFRYAFTIKKDKLARGILLSTFIYAFIYFFNYIEI